MQESFSSGWPVAADPIVGLVCGYPSPLREKKIIVVLKGFADDSGSSGGNRDGDHFAIAGFLGTAAGWVHFADEWDAECRSHPATLDFHMAKAMRPIGSREGYVWTEAERRQRIENLVSIIIRWAALRVSCVVLKSGYNAIVKGKIPAAIDSPYFLLFYTAITAAADYMAKERMEGTIDWVFDDQGDLGNEVGGYYNFIRDRCPPFIKPKLGAAPIFRHDRDMLPLKAADILAWSLRRHHALEQPIGQAVKPHLDRLLGKTYGVMAKIDGAELSAFVANLPHGLAINAQVQHHFPSNSPRA